MKPARTKFSIICLRALGVNKNALPEGTTFTEKCSLCGSPVALAPTSQRLRTDAYQLICQYCYVPQPNDTYGLAPGFEQESAEIQLRQFKPKGPPS